MKFRRPPTDCPSQSKALLTNFNGFSNFMKAQKAF